ncbi:MAG: hypothetical protein V4540_17515, partial [Pseudomonadota bacterium]
MSQDKEHRHSDLRMIPLERIEVLNPRERNSRVFEQIVGNIQSIGLKKPIAYFGERDRRFRERDRFG